MSKLDELKVNYINTIDTCMKDKFFKQVSLPPMQATRIKFYNTVCNIFIHNCKQCHRHWIQYVQYPYALKVIHTYIPNK